MERGNRPKKYTLSSDYDKIMHINIQKHRIVEDLLVRVITTDSREHQQALVPSHVVATILEFLYDQMGHPGRERTTALVMELFYWPRMRHDIAKWVDNCDRCIKFKTTDNQRASLVSIITTQPLQLVCMDYLTLESSKGCIQNILIILASLPSLPRTKLQRLPQMPCSIVLLSLMAYLKLSILTKVRTSQVSSSKSCVK